jgi:uncharacterized membrane protein SpoIIM required for sporulation
MKETKFIKDNKDKWQRFENLNSQTKANPEELSNLYIDITDDLAYAQTHYQRRTVRVYLNQLAQNVFVGVNKYKKDSFKSLLRQVTTSIPLEVYRSRKTLLTALIAFLIYAAIGVISTIINPDFPRAVMGDDYVDMTIANIEAGNPLGVYQSSEQLSMFIRITTNNLMVAFLTFFVGILFTLGTHLMLFSNGVMLGAFQYYFFTKGLLITSFLGIWIHGAFEISAIVIAGGAGITIGNGWLFPGTFSRFQSLKLALRRGVKIMLFLVPFIIMAGFLESYVTRHYNTLPDWTKLAIIVFSFLLMIFAFVLYPFYLAKRYPELVEKEEELSGTNRYEPVFNTVKSLGELIRESLLYYSFYFSKLFSSIFTLVFSVAVIAIGIRDYLRPEDLYLTYWFDWAGQLEFMLGYGFYFWFDALLFVLWIVLFSFIASKVMFQIGQKKGEFADFSVFFKKKFVGILVSTILTIVPILLLPWTYLIAYLFVFPFFQLLIPMAVFGNDNLLKNLLKGFNYSASNYFNALFGLTILGAIAFLFSQPFSLVLSIVNEYSKEPLIPDLLDLLTDFVIKIADTYGAHGVFWSNVVRQLFYFVFLLLAAPLYLILSAFMYFSIIEKKEAKFLKEEFYKFGKRDRLKETKDFED